MPVAVEITDDIKEAATPWRRRVRRQTARWDPATRLLQRGLRPPRLRRRRGRSAGAVAHSKREEAAARVPNRARGRTPICWARRRIQGRLRLYRDAGITTIQASSTAPGGAQLDALAQLMDLVREVDADFFFFFFFKKKKKKKKLRDRVTTTPEDVVTVVDDDLCDRKLRGRRHRHREDVEVVPAPGRRFEAKAICEPSIDQAGVASRPAWFVRRV